MTEHPNVVLIVLDTVRRDRVSAYGYDRNTTPVFDEFAENSTVYEDAVSQSSWSIPSHASLLTGQYPSAHGATTVRPFLQAKNTLPAQLQQEGYETYAVCPNIYVRPLTGFGRGFDEFHTGRRLNAPTNLVSALGPTLNSVTASAKFRRPLEQAFNGLLLRGSKTGTRLPPDYGVVSQVNSILSRAEEPYFLFVNLPHAHLPRSPAPEHRERFVDDSLPVKSVVRNERTHNLGDSPMDSDAMETMSSLYDADLRTLDDRLRNLLEALESVGVRDDSLVIITADHGEHLGENGLVGHQHSVFDPVVSVPLVIDFPHIGPDTIESQVETRRIYHTVLDAAGVASHPDRTLASGEGDEIARGSFHSPMLDLSALIADGRVEHRSALLGEPLQFQREQDRKRISFDDEHWELPVPEFDEAADSRATVSERSE